MNRSTSKYNSFCRPVFQITAILLQLSFLLSGCSNFGYPKYYRIEDMPPIKTISILVNTLVTVDLSGNTDGLDVAKNKLVAQNISTQIDRELNKKGLTVVNRFHSFGNFRNANETYFMIESENDYEKSTSELEKKRGPFYSDKLSDQQIKSISNATYDSKDTYIKFDPQFDGDIVLVAFMRTRSVGVGKQLGAALVNVATVAIRLFAASSAGNSGGNGGEAIPADDYVYVDLRIFERASGELLWKAKIETENMQSLQDVLSEKLTNITLTISKDYEKRLQLLKH